MNSNNHEIICKALVHLAEMCDGATTQDNRGFNKYDSGFGKSLAYKSQDSTLTDKQHAAAYYMLKKYESQLTRGGIKLPELEELKQWLETRAKQTPLQQVVEYKEALGEINCVENLLGMPILCLVRFPYDIKKNEIVKEIGKECNNRAMFSTFGYGWEFKNPSPEILAKLTQAFPDFKVDENTKKWARTYQNQQQEIALRVARTNALRQEETEKVLANLDLDAPIGDKRLFGYQKDGIKEMIMLRRAILAWDMGLGKTIVSLIVSKAFSEVLGYHVIIICPASLKDVWKREMAEVGVNAEVFSNHHLSIPQPPEADFILIADEAHAFQDLKSMRTAAFLHLAESPLCQACFPLSGTPMKNGRPANLFPLLRAVRHRLGSSKKHFYDRYVREFSYGSTERDKTGGAHLKELHKILTQEERVLLRLTKKECLDLPPKTRVLRPVEVSPTSKKEYRQVFNDLQKAYKERIKRQEITSEGEALVALTHLRHAASRAKVEEGINLAMEILERGDQIVIFGNFKDTQNLVASAIGAEIINADTPMPDRQPIADRFQSGETRALVCGFGAGGVGLTLTATDTVILLDRPWTPGDAIQAEDRIYRIGQYYPTTAIWVQAFPVDEKIDATLQQKQRKIELVLVGREEVLIDSSTGKSIAKQIFEELMQSDWDGAEKSEKIVRLIKKQEAMANA